MSDAPRWAERRADGGAAESSGALYRALVESVVDYAIFALDSTGHILSWNRGAARLKGYDAGEIIGRHYSVFPQPKQSSAVIWSGLLALGLTVVSAGVWAALLLTNLRTSPAVPWSVVVMGALLWLMWQYLNGKGWPASTARTRHQSLRARMVPPAVLAWALAAGLFSIVALTGFWIVLFQLVRASGNRLPDLSQYPPLTVALALAMAATMGAVTEEAGFRGYLQGTLERKLGAVAAIAITALVIAPAHGLTQGFAWSTVLFYLLVDAMFGVMAFLTNSILPGIVVHAIGLLMFFVVIWPLDSTRRAVYTDGADGWFWIHAVQVLTFGLLAIMAFRRLSKVSDRQLTVEG